MIYKNYYKRFMKKCIQSKIIIQDIQELMQASEFSFKNLLFVASSFLLKVVLKIGVSALLSHKMFLQKKR